MLLELGELGRMAKAMGVESVANGLFCTTVGGKYPLWGNHAPQLGSQHQTLETWVCWGGRSRQGKPSPKAPFKQLHSRRTSQGTFSIRSGVTSQA